MARRKYEVWIKEPFSDTAHCGSFRHFDTGKRPTLAELQEWVGGYIEKITLSPTTSMYVDEDGLAKGLPFNDWASVMLGHKIVGTSVVVKRP